MLISWTIIIKKQMKGIGKNFCYVVAIYLLTIQTFYALEPVLAESFSNLQEEFDAIRAQIIDEDGYVREDLVDTLGAIQWIHKFAATVRIVQWKRINMIGKYNATEMNDHIKLSVSLLQWINNPHIDYLEKARRLAIVYNSPSVQNLSKFMEIYASK